MKRAGIEDLPRVVDMMQAFHTHEPQPWPFVREHAFNFALGLIQTGNLLGVTRKGFIAGMLYRHPINPEWVTAAELLWWADDRQGLRLMQGFREWARASGADEIRYSCPDHNDRVKAIMGRFGQVAETAFSEVI